MTSRDAAPHIEEASQVSRHDGGAIGSAIAQTLAEADQFARPGVSVGEKKVSGLRVWGCLDSVDRAARGHVPALVTAVSVA